VTDDHGPADREHAVERYLLGEMSDAERDRYEEHFFGCADCANDVTSTAAFLDALRASLAPPARQEPLKTAAILERWWSVQARALRALVCPLLPAAALA
jgi:anti-sigma factor RsiW